MPPESRPPYGKVDAPAARAARRRQLTKSLPSNNRRSNSAVDMRQLTNALVEAREGTGEVRAILLRAAFKPRLPGGACYSGTIRCGAYEPSSLTQPACC